MRLVVGIITVFFTAACNLSFGAITLDPTPDDAGANPMPGCAPEGWVRVTIYAGETLETLAAGTSISVQEVLDANCLAAPTDVSAGEQIWLPVPPTRVQGRTVIEPIDMIGTNTGILTPGQTVVIKWKDAPDTITSGEIAYFPASDDPALVQSIVFDDELSDGISAEWTVPDELDGYVIASARLPGQTHESVAALELWVSTRP